MRLAADFRLAAAGDFLAGGLAADFLAAGLRLAADFLAAGLRFAADFFAAGLRLAADFRLAAGFRAAVFFRAVDFFAAGLRAAVFLLAVRPSWLLPCCPLPFPFVSGSRIGPYDAMRFRRRRSRSLMPPHTPYRSSRRSA